MGSCCCCFARGESEYSVQNSNGCFRCCFRLCCGCCCYDTYATRAEDTSLSPERCGSTSASAGLLFGASFGTSTPDTYRAPPMPLPYDSDTGTHCNDRQGARCDKGGPVQQRDTLPHQESMTEDKALAAFETLKNADAGKLSPPEKCQPSKTSEILYNEEEDVCPTCLEEYDEENPRIFTKCEHHFHLACILEWLERSDCCPMCYKEIIIDECYG